MIKKRNSVKLVLLNANKEILMIYSKDSTTGKDGSGKKASFWHLIGGQIEKGESLQDAAYRELFEETGLTRDQVVLEDVVWYGSDLLFVNGEFVELNQRFILAYSCTNSVTMDHLTEEEKVNITRLKWFGLEELRATKEVVYPTDLHVYLQEILNGNIPKQPIEISL